MQDRSLKNSIATLQKLRDAHHSQLDADALAELDNVLFQLRTFSSSEKREPSREDLAIRVLRIMDVVIRAVSNLTDWMK